MEENTILKLSDVKLYIILWLIIASVILLSQYLIFYLWPGPFGVPLLVWIFEAIVILILYFLFKLLRKNLKTLKILTLILTGLIPFLQLKMHPQERGEAFYEAKKAISYFFNIGGVYSKINFYDSFFQRIELNREDKVKRTAAEVKYSNMLPSKRATLFYEKEIHGSLTGELIKKVYLWKANNELFYSDSCLILLNSKDKYCFLDTCFYKTTPFYIDTSLENFAVHEYGLLKLSLYRSDTDYNKKFDNFFSFTLSKLK